ncbi:MAG: tyrosine-type recombinase/integrase [Erysipelotrichaceae bacterium]|nr:tyrosine-type recombinase/integrase [Erysipelotrichaceae bacterium]
MLNSRDICFQWLEEKRISIKPLSYDKYETAVNKYLLSFFNQYSIDNLDQHIIEDYLYHQIELGISHSTAKFLKSTIKSIYIYAERIYHLNHIDFSCIKIDENRKSATITLTDKQEDIVFKYCVSHHDALSVAILLSLYLGLKFSEICVLQYSDIHLDEQYIDIHKMVQRSVNRENDITKTILNTIDLIGTSKRQVFLSDFMCDYLRDFMGEYDERKYLLNRTYRLPDQRTYQNKLKQLGNQNGFEITFLILRNTFKENCIKNNVDMKTLMNMLGVSNIVITSNDNTLNYFNNQKEVEKLLPKIRDYSN